MYKYRIEKTIFIDKVIVACSPNMSFKGQRQYK